MNTSLPSEFLARMESQLKNEYEPFLKSYENSRFYGIRANLLKKSADTFPDEMPFNLTKVDWAPEGFYYSEEERPGKHPLHEAGAYYIQEPSAMSAVALLDPLPGDIVLDLCAAPGGKSTQIGARLNGKGLLISNEIVPSRAKILSQNIERMGIRNAIVTNESPEKLNRFFPGFFDKILVDAPCSGEGMFRKDETAIKEWSPENVTMCAQRQQDILKCVVSMLKPGGKLLYSTCTFSEAENEENARWFTDTYPEFRLIKSERFMPHLVKGEGHFVALFEKAGTLERKASPVCAGKDISSFMTGELKIVPRVVGELVSNCNINRFGENIYLTPSYISNLKGLSVERPGLMVAKDLGKRLEPAHSLAISLRPYEVTDRVDLSYEEAVKYIAGETVNCSSDKKGWICVFYEGCSLGWGKATNGILKNHYPKGLRTNL